MDAKQPITVGNTKPPGVVTTASVPVKTFGCVVAGCTFQTTNFQTQTQHNEYEKLIEKYGDSQSNTTEQKNHRNTSYKMNCAPCFIYGCFYDVHIVLLPNISFNWVNCIKTHIRKDHAVDTELPFGCATEGCTFRTAVREHLSRHVDMRHPKRATTTPTVVPQKKPIVVATTTSEAKKPTNDTPTPINISVDSPWICSFVGCLFTTGDVREAIDHVEYESMWCDGFFIEDFEKTQMKNMVSRSPYLSMLCPVHGCLYITKTKSDIIAHMRQHDNDKNYICPVSQCRKQNIATRQDVKIHVREHNFNRSIKTLKAMLDQQIAMSESIQNPDDQATNKKKE